MPTPFLNRKILHYCCPNRKNKGDYATPHQLLCVIIETWYADLKWFSEVFRLQNQLICFIEAGFNVLTISVEQQPVDILEPLSRYLTSDMSPSPVWGNKNQDSLIPSAQRQSASVSHRDSSGSTLASKAAAPVATGPRCYRLINVSVRGDSIWLE